MFFLNYSTLIDPLLRDIRVYVVKFSGMKAGDRVLDVCCGTGDQAFYYAEAGMVASGIDLDPHMLKLARKDKRKQALRNVSFQLADARNLPFKDNSFDYASISLALHEKDRNVRDRVISEMKRVVRKGGALIFIDFQVPLPKNLFACFIRSIEFVAGREHHRYFKDYIEQGGLDEILKKNRLTAEKRDFLNNGLITIVKTGDL
jgi:ubiquinone/menaquinone biosynthesis C-methylase UbiE